MAEVRLQLDGKLPLNAWEQQKALRCSGDTPLFMTPLPGATNAGRCAVVLGMQLPEGRWVIGSTTLRALYSAMKGIVAQHGEVFMQQEMGFLGINDREARLQMALRTVVAQLAEAKQRLGEGLQLEFEQADAEYDRLHRIEMAARRLDSLLGEFGHEAPEQVAEAVQAVHEALHPVLKGESHS